MHPALLLILIFFIILFLFLFYQHCCFKDVIDDEDEKECKEEKFKIAILNNYGSGVIESRIVNVIIDKVKNKYYISSNKETYHVKQLNTDNRVSLLICHKINNVFKQKLLYGKLEVVENSDTLILYELIVEHCKNAITKENKKERITTYTYDGTDKKEIRTEFCEMGELFQNFILTNNL